MYSILKKIHDYLTLRNIDIEKDKYIILNNYINDMDCYLVKGISEYEYYTNHFFFSDNKDRMHIHINLLDNIFRVSTPLKDNIKDMLGYDIKNIERDILDIHFKELNNIRIRQEAYGFFGEHNDDVNEELKQKSYDNYRFKRIDKETYHNMVERHKNR